MINSKKNLFILTEFLKKYNLVLDSQIHNFSKNESNSFLRVALFTDKIKTVLKNSLLNNKEKQEKLENLMNPFLKKSENFQYLFAGTLLQKTKMLQQDLCFKGDPLEHDIRRLSKSELKDDLTQSKRKLRSLGSEKTNFYLKYDNMLRMFSKNESEAAFTVIMSISSSYSNLTLDMETISKELLEFLSNSKSSSSLSEKSLNKMISLEFTKKIGPMKRTSFIMKLASSFYLKYKTLYHFEKKEDSKKDPCLELSNKELIYLALQLEFLLIKHKIIEYGVFKNEHEDNEIDNTMGETDLFHDLDEKPINLEEKEDLDLFFSNKFYTIKISDDILENLLKSDFFSSSIPMIEKPICWKKEKDLNQQTFSYNSSTRNYKLITKIKEVLCGGGLFSNKSNLFTGVHSKDKRSYSWVPNDIIDNLNYLQGQAFQINESALNFTKKNIFYMLRAFLLDKNFNINNIAFQNDDIIHIYNFDSYMQAAYGPTVDRDDLLKDMKKFSFYLNKYLVLYQAVVEFFFLLELADVLKNRKLFFQAFFDNRGRIYTHGYPLSPQGNCFSKFLLDFYNENISQENKAEINVDLFEFEKKKGSALFEYLKVQLKTNSYVSLDASCSGISIISGLIGYRLGLIKTNILTERFEGSEIKEDYYLFIKSKIIQKIQKQLITYSYDKQRVESLQVLSDCFTRDFVKKWVIRYIYGESGFTRCKELKKVFLEKKNISVFNDDIIFSDFERMIFKEYSFHFDYFICLEINEFITFLKKVFVEVKTDEQPFIKICSKANLESFFSIIYISMCEKSKMKWRYLFSPIKEGTEKILKESQFVYYKLTDKLDRKKLNRTILSHFIHHLDSVLLNYVVKECRLRNLNIFTAHDCFMVDPENLEIVKNFYKEAFINELFLGNPVEAFLLENSGIPLPSSIGIELDKYRQKKMFLYAEIYQNANLHKMSDLQFNIKFILN